MGWVNWRSEKVEVNTQESSPEYRRRQILCRRLKTDLGIVRVRVVYVPRSIEIHPWFFELKAGVPKGRRRLLLVAGTRKGQVQGRSIQLLPLAGTCVVGYLTS